jgi:hypothetical protein
MRFDRPVMLQFRQYVFCKMLPEFHAPLIEAEYIPDNALNEYLVFIHGDQASQDFWGELFE